MSIYYFITSPDDLTQPLTHPRIGYQTITRLPGVVVTATAANGFAFDGPLRPDTYERWKPTAVPANWQIDALAAQDVDYVGIAAHTLGTSGCEFIMQYSSDAVTWTDFGESMIVANNAPVMILADEVSARYWRLRILSGAAPEVGVVYIGKALALQRRIYGGHTPITLSRETMIRPQKSEGGQFLAKTIIRRGVKTSASILHITPDWYRDNFDPFVLSARQYPYFWAWYPSRFPKEVGYVWTGDDIAPSNMGTGKGWMQVDWNMEGFADAD